VALTYETATKKLKTYRDGIIDLNVTTTNLISIIATDKVSIGMELDGASGSDFYSGLMNDVRIYDKALSAKEVYQISKAKIAH